MYQIFSKYLNGKGGYEIKVVTSAGVQNPPHVKLSISVIRQETEKLSRKSCSF